MIKHLLLILICFIALSCAGERELTAEELLRASSEYLWSQQHEDGGWHSGTHGIASGGESWTPFVLYHLLLVPDSIYHRDNARVERALANLRSSISSSGVVGNSDPMISDYPNYATSYAARCLVVVDSPADSNLIAKMRTYLVGQQMTELRGFEKADLVYGGWGFGEKNLPPGVPGHVDLSHSRRVAEALSAMGADPPVMQNLQLFLETVQRHPNRYNDASLPYDGGFFASPVVDGVNKGGFVAATDSTSAYFRSYATATADGILALFAADVDANDQRVQDAYRWLSEHPGFETPSGIPEYSPVPWDDVMFFYHLSSRAEVYRRLAETSDWTSAVTDLLRDKQYPDGHFSNPAGSPNKEDDPLIATTLAVNALLAVTDNLTVR